MPHIDIGNVFIFAVVIAVMLIAFDAFDPTRNRRRK